MKRSIGNTPLSLSNLLSKAAGCRVYIKEEYHNPGASSKDRIAWYMIRDAENRGLIKPGHSIVEASSGNTAIGLAMICKQRGYKCIVFMNSSGSEEKVRIIESLGGQVIRCKTSGGPDDPESSQYQAAAYAASTPNAYYCNQYFNHVNSIAHYEGTGPELWQQTSGKITHFICGVGTGGTITGAGRFLKEHKPDIKVLGVDPYGSVLSHYFLTGSVTGYEPKSYPIEGIGRNFIPGAMDFSVVSDFIQVDGQESAEACHNYSRMTGFQPGFSSGAVLAAFMQIKQSFRPTDSVVLFFADNGDRYQSKLYNPKWLRQHIFDEEGWVKFSRENYQITQSYV